MKGVEGREGDNVRVDNRIYVFGIRIQLVVTCLSYISSSCIYNEMK